MNIKGYSNVQKRYLLSFLLLFPFLATAFGQNTKIRIEAPESVLTGEQFKVNYVIESDSEVKDPVIIKNMEAFTIIYGPSLSTSISTTFNKGKRQTSYVSISSYLLQGDKAGKYELPRTEITVNGKKYKPDAVRIEVKSTEEIDAFVKTSVSKSTISMTDTLTITYRLYTTKDINRIKSVNFPSLREFYHTNVTQQRQQFTEEVIDGQTYKVADLRVLILQPRSEGRFEIPEGQIEIEYATPTGKKKQNRWGETFEEVLTTNKILKIEPTEIVVHNMKAV